MTKFITTLHAKDLMSEIRDRFAWPKESPEWQNAAQCNEIFGHSFRGVIWKIKYFAVLTIFDNL